MAYAEGTTVSPENSQLEIAKLIRKYGATSFATGWDNGRALVEFIAEERRIRFILVLPTDPAKFAVMKGGRVRSGPQRLTAMESEVRRLWRALALAIKAKLEVVESGIATFETEFLGNIVMPDGQTVAEHVLPRVEQAYKLGQVGTQLLALESGR